MPSHLLEPGCLYHVYNHAVGTENLFLSEQNYHFFLKRYRYFIEPVADTYAYCLMPNHFHFLVAIKGKIAVPDEIKYPVELYVSKQFANLFSSYTQAFNKDQSRTGSLFRSTFKRQHVDTDQYMTRIISYIHMNPIKHGFTTEVSNWKYSSYNALCSETETFLRRDKVMSWFGNLEEFKKAHVTAPKLFERGFDW